MDQQEPAAAVQSAAGGLSRRRLLKLAGWGVAGAAVAGSGLAIGASALAQVGDVAGAAEKTSITVRQWQATRGPKYYIAHRGSGDVLPEHSMAAYQAAVGWGAMCMEISVGMTSDGVLICMHDLDYDRTTSGSGPVNGQPASVLQTIRIMQPRLGQAWVTDPPRVPLFEDVLKTFGERVVLAVEAKLNAAYEPMMAMVEKYGLRDSVIVKAHYQSKRWAQAQAAGYPVFCYFGSATEALPTEIGAIAAQLDPNNDVLVIPAFTGAGEYLADDVVAAAVGTGIPVWAFPLHRRADADHVFARGVVGGVCSSYGYIAGSAATLTADDWATQAVCAGEMTKDPSSDSLAPGLTADGELVLAAADEPTLRHARSARYIAEREIHRHPGRRLEHQPGRR